MIRLQIMGETPSKKNSKVFVKVKGHPVPIPSKAHKKWHDDAMVQLQSYIGLAMLGDEMPKAIDYPVRINLTFVHGDKVRRDSDNQVSSIMDLLQDAMVLSDDRWEIVREIHVKNEYEKNEARCLIEIERV